MSSAGSSWRIPDKMVAFTYAGRDSTGTVIRGRVDAEDDLRARAVLRQQGLFVTSIQVEEAGPGPTHSRDRREDVAVLTHQLSVLIAAGLPVRQALDALTDQLDDPYLRQVARALAADIQEGTSISAALGRHPDLFSPIYIGLVRQGEVSGRLDQALARLARFLHRDLELRQRVRDALLYPALVLGMAAFVMAVFIAFVIPSFERVYRNAGVSLPLLTRAALAVVHVVRSAFPLVVAAPVVLMVIRPTRRLVSGGVVRLAWALILRVPQAGAVARTVMLSRFCHAMASVLSSGVPLMTGLDIAREAAGSGHGAGGSRFDQVFEPLRKSVSEGLRLSQAMQRSGGFTPLVIRMVALGEGAGRLDAMLGQAAELLDHEFDRRMRRLLIFLEPALTLAVAGIVALILLVLYLPIFGLARTIAR